MLHTTYCIDTFLSEIGLIRQVLREQMTLDKSEPTVDAAKHALCQLSDFVQLSTNKNSPRGFSTHNVRQVEKKGHDRVSTATEHP